jgi:UDP-N-acetylmuramoyl-L-alanyl-D-glutamate--2,6-diaminopimelate ligase
VNADDPWGRRLLETPAIPTTTYALDRDADITGHDVRVDRAGLSFTVDGTVFRSPLRGRFNAANCLAAVAVARALGMGDDVTAAALASHGGVPGRMEPVEAGQDFLVVVDYAHTPDSILGVLRGARPLATGRVIVVFGCGGDRDRAKRPAMGRAATSEADLTVITTDNPRSEDPLRIIDEIVAGAEGGGAYVVEPDRRAAIAHAVREARAGDVVVIAGKGHETVQELRGDSVPFDDRVVAREELERAAHADGARP